MGSCETFPYRHIVRIVVAVKCRRSQAAIEGPPAVESAPQSEVHQHLAPPIRDRRPPTGSRADATEVDVFHGVAANSKEVVKRPARVAFGIRVRADVAGAQLRCSTNDLGRLSQDPHLVPHQRTFDRVLFTFPL
jgi:hypothetical protein